MIKYFGVCPEVPGRIGDKTDFDASVWPPRLANLEYEFEDWLGDAIAASFPCYIVTKQLAADLRASAMTGFEFDRVTVTKSPNFDELYASKKTGPLPAFEWLKIVGIHNHDDMGIYLRHLDNGKAIYRLIVSERALELFRKHGFRHAEVDVAPVA